MSIMLKTTWDWSVWGVSLYSSDIYEMTSSRTRHRCAKQEGIKLVSSLPLLAI